MNIGALAQLTGVSADTLRYYEREKLLAPPCRAANGYRVYNEADAARVRFVRSAQALGFSLAEIRWILPRLNAGQVQRAEIETHLNKKLAEIDGHIKQLRTLRKEVQATLSSLRCEQQTQVTVQQATSEAMQRAPARRVAGPRRRTA
ncbi:MAG TPA: MerR family transcriptional regulator [Ideonella sp.]|uniref:MerR family transcriptional regulator n=1 Tax=Ideonella sp. TaxID=1929293 RepID=UPI002E300D69|nr:MerR family transcriptional regulator [Ideonella sp.]HEX5686185.1 MerR family transcriptional regulator [Ideonella sp.]